jgi:ribosomal RNA-processing protein 7
MATLPNSIAGFTVLPILYGSSTTHILYARPHIGAKNASGRSKLPDGRTLFLVNVPPYATERELVLLFKDAGTVEKVVFDLGALELQGVDHERPLRTLRRTGQTAHVVFLDSSSLDRALSCWPKKTPPWPTSSDEPLGMARYVALYDSLRPPLDAVREHADSYMEAYECELAKSKQQSKYRKGEAIVDEDGFTLVTRGGAYGQTLGGGVAVATKEFQETGQTRKNDKKKKTPKEKEAFYGFQKSEKQRKGAVQFCPQDRF